MKKLIKNIWHSRLFKVTIILLLMLLVLPMMLFSGMWIGCQTAEFNDDYDHVSWGSLANDIEGYSRNEEQTYLTFPEWYIVFNADEYAAFIKNNPPSEFAYFRSVGQYWGGYCKVYALTRNYYSFNYTYHSILFVIGSSFSLESIAKGIYENTFGKLTEVISTKNLTAEDHYAQKVAAEYGNFLHTVPWYEFSFLEKLWALWTDVPWWGANPIRKWERRMILSSEYAFKSMYATLIKGGTQTAYQPAELSIYAVVELSNKKLIDQYSQLTIINQLEPNYFTISLPRYEEFTQLVPRLIESGLKFKEIAGNDEILISVITSSQPSLIPEAEVLFSMPILSDSQKQRVLVRVPVGQLHEVLADLKSKSITLEHIYDY